MTTTSSARLWSREIKKWKRRHYKWCSKMKGVKSINKSKREVLTKTVLAMMMNKKWAKKSKWLWSSQNKKHRTIKLDRKWNMVNNRSFRQWMRLMVLKWQWRCLKMKGKEKLLINKVQISKIWWWTPRDSNKYYKWVNRKKTLDSRNKRQSKLMRISCWWEVYNSLKKRAPKKSSLPNKRKIWWGKLLNCQ